MVCVFSAHALSQMAERNITQEQVLRVIGCPLSVEEGEILWSYQALVEFSGKPYLLRVFMNVRKYPNVIITVYRTSKISKYER
jgi:hypothetical protein